VLIKASKVPASRAYHIRIKGFRNPFSEVPQTHFVVRHFPKCQNLPTDVNHPYEDNSEPIPYTACNLYGESEAEPTFNCWGPEFTWRSIS
jgi:hypothetical protein